ncbi:hypothetical protein QBC35DRAFT_60321 [Podospora australis]|uniref:C2H2 type master regulator of conidiophore development brlA n=1 Tax=Podospora australis TaxID=1536484 RepID=A0AAN6WLG6_9PEZI|nr:hypothetical protein QBC35DRAFT_60321 [Podospora australis]
MALSEHLPPLPSWSAHRWPQHPPSGGDYPIMDANNMPSHTTSAPPPQRSSLASQYYPNYTISLAPITTIPAPHYQQPPVTYMGYQSYTPSPILGSPFRAQHFSEEQMLRGSETSRSVYSTAQESSSPRGKIERRGSITATTPVSLPSKPCKTIAYIAPVAGAETREFHTPLDDLMKAVQAKTQPDALGSKGEPHSQQDQTSALVQPSGSSANTEEASGSKQRKASSVAKQFCCGIGGCPLRFSQKTHLDVHRRAHTGESPYICPACGKTFTQSGNFKAHWRRHTGEKPFKCTKCDKRFPQRGNLQAHMRSHDKSTPFVCKLDHCNKAFTLRGNLKFHQNKFHNNTIRRLTQKFSLITDWSSASDEDREMFEYLATLYKNSNKGIKGRGKRRNVALLVHSDQPGSPMSPQSAIHSPHSMHIPHGLPQLCLPQPRHDSFPFHGLSNPAAYNMSRPNLTVNLGHHRPHGHGGYMMYDTDDSSISSSGPVTPNPHMYSEHDHGKELAFGERHY